MGSKSPKGSLGVQVFSSLSSVCVGVVQIAAFKKDFSAVFDV